MVLFDDFGNRVLPSAEGRAGPMADGRLYVRSVEVAEDLMLVGPGGELTSAKGLKRDIHHLHH